MMKQSYEFNPFSGNFDSVYKVDTSDYPKSKPILNLDFANTKVLDPRITFSRSSTATRVNEFGLIEEVASDVPRFDHDPVTLESKGLLIEESRTNLFEYSNQLMSSYWSALNTTKAQSSESSFDGALSATSFYESVDISNQTHVLIERSLTKAASSNPYSYSVYITPKDHHVYRLSLDFGGTTNQVYATFDLSNGAVLGEASTGTFSGAKGSIEKLGSGYKITISGTSGAETTIRGRLSSAVSHSAVAYTGTGKKLADVYAAQLEAGAFPTSYAPSVETFTSRASTATYIDSTGKIATAAINAPRLSYNPENLNVPPKLLLEGASTNLALYSEDLSNAYWNKQQATVSTGSASPIEGVTYSKLIPSTSNASHYINKDFTSVPTGIHSFSFFAKSSGYNFVRLRLALDTIFASSFIVNLESGEVSGFSGSTPISATVQKLTNGYRIAGTYSTSTIATHTLAAWVYDTAASSGAFAGDGTSGIELTGIQFEEGYLSSYIPTTSAPVTRSEDVYTSTASTRAADLASITGANFSSWYRQDEGTFVVGFNPHYQPNSRHFFSVGDGTTQNRIRLNTTSGGGVNGFITANNVPQMDVGFPGTSVSDTFFNAAFSYKQNDSAISVNGLTPVSDSSVIIPQVNRLNILCSETGSTIYNGWISRLAYYPRRITNLELQAVTV